MTIDEMHVAIEFALQRQASGEYTSIEAEEIDLAINISQDRFVLSQVNPTSPSTDTIGTSARRQLQSLIVKNFRKDALKPIPADGYDSYFYEDDMYYVTLPEDWLYPINQRVTIERLLNNRCQEIDISESNEPAYKEYVAVLNFVANEDDVCVPSPVLKIEVDGEPIFDLSQFPAIQDVYRNVEDKHKVINIVLEFLNRFNSLAELINYASPTSNPIENTNALNDFAVYWENYGTMKYPSSFIFVSTDAGKAVNVPIADDIDFNALPSGKLMSLITNADGVTIQSSMNFQQRTFVKVAPIGYGEDLVEEVTVPIRLTDKEDFYIKQRNPFWTTTDEDVQGNWYSNKLLAYTDKSFTCKQFVMDYIKRPSRVNKSLSWNCELHSSVHQAIVEHAVAYILEVTSNPRLQTNVAQRTYYGE